MLSDYIFKIKLLFTDTKRLFSIISNEPLSYTLFHLFVLSVIFMFISFISSLPNISILGILLFSSLIMVFISGAVMNMTLQIMKKANIHDYEKTIRIAIYSLTPYVLISWIPYIRVIATPLMLYFLYIGISENYDTKAYQTLLAIASPIIFGFIVSLAF